MTISVSVLSPAFFTDRGVSTATAPVCTGDPCAYAFSHSDTFDPQAEMKPADCTRSRDADYSITTPRMHPTTGCCPCRESYAMSPRSVTVTSPSPRMASAASPSPRLMAVASPSPRTGGGRSQGKKKGNKKKGPRKRAPDGESKEAKPMQILTPTTINTGVEGAHTGAFMSHGGRSFSDGSVENRQTGPCACCGHGGMACAVETTQGPQVGPHRTTDGNVDARMEVDVVLRDVREECSSALGIVKEDLELFRLCRVPCFSEKTTLLKDKSGLVHMGVMVRNSDLNLQSIEELIIHKDKAEQNAESSLPMCAPLRPTAS